MSDSFLFAVEFFEALSWWWVCEAHAGCFPFRSLFSFYFKNSIFLLFCICNTALIGHFLLKQDNELLHDIFGFTPKKKSLLGVEHQISSSEKVSSFVVPD